MVFFTINNNRFLFDWFWVVVGFFGLFLFLFCLFLGFWGCFLGGCQL